MKTLDFVSLFAGAGGLDLGLEQAGWQCRYASDIDPDAVVTMERNRGLSLLGSNRQAFITAYTEQSDIRDLDGAEILAKAGGFSRGDIPLLAGGPPCQSWSSAGHQHGFDDPRGRLFSDFIRLASEMDVRWILFENVRGLLTARSSDGQPGSALGLIRNTLLKAGYQSTVSILNAADFGVPQRRVRLFIIGYRNGDKPRFPSPTHAKPGKGEGASLPPWVTLGECLDGVGDLRVDEIVQPSGKMAKELEGILPGSGVKSPGKKESTRPGGHWGYKQGAFVADLLQAARTVTASGQQDWVRNTDWGLRRLCPRECAAIQTFPSDWRWTGKNSTRYRLIGNAVPPALARAVGGELRRLTELEDASLMDTHTCPEAHRLTDLTPLPPELVAAISYTAREEKANGASRRSAPARRRSRLPLVAGCP